MKAYDDVERGGATIEFLAVSVILLVPIVYLILTFSTVQAATYAAESAARESARIYARASDDFTAARHAQQATQLAFSDHGIQVALPQALKVRCEHSPCLTPGGGVQVEVSHNVALPLVPDFLAELPWSSITVVGHAYVTVDRFKDQP